MKKPLSFLFVVCVLLVFVSWLQGQEAEKTGISVTMVIDDLKNGNPRVAAQNSVLLLQTDSKSAEAHALYGLALIDCGECKKAESEFRLALSINPDTPEAHLGIGKLVFAEGDHKKAIDHLYKATSTSSLKYMAHDFLARHLSYLNRHGEAKKILTDALEKIDDLKEYDRAYLKNNIAIFDGFKNTKLYRISEDFRSTHLSFTNSDGHILLPVKVNGLDIGNVHLDTGGSGGLTISAEKAKDLNLEIIGQRVGRNATAELKAEVAILDELQVGELIVKNVPVNILDSSGFHGGSSGNLGKELIQRLNMTVDFKNSELSFFHPGYPDLQTGRIEQKNPSEKIGFFNINFIIVKASINGHDPEPFILDTGAGAVVFHQDYFLETLKPPAEGNEKNSKLQGPTPFNVNSIRLGNRTYKDIFSIALDLGELYSFAKVYYPGIIGNPLFRNSRLHFNFVDSTLVIEEVQ
jgi:predicted aspartyl protease